MNKTIIVGLAVVASLTLAACGGSSGKSSPSKSAGSASASASAAPAPGSKPDETITLGTAQLPPNAGDPFYGSETPQTYTLSPIYDGLTKTSSDGTVQPALATSWTQNDATDWTFTLRSGVKFTDGSALTPDGVVSVFNYLISGAGAKLATSTLIGVSAATAVGTDQVKLTTKAPDAILPAILDELYIPSAQALASGGEAGLAKNPVGTGPFTVTSWGSTRVTMDANPDSWRAPIVGHYVIQVLPDQAARFQALQSGQIDLATALSPDQIAQLTPDVGAANITPVPQVMSLAYMNNKASSPFNDVRVRQALNYAVDKDSIAKNLLLGKSTAQGQGATKVVNGYNSAVSAYPYDPAKAKSLLAAAGYANGFSFSADVVVGTFANDTQIYEEMASDLAKVGVKVTLNQVQFSAWLPDYLKADFGSSTAFGLSWNGYPTLDIGKSDRQFSCLQQPVAFFCDQPTATALSAALSAPTAAARKTQLQAVSQMMYDNPPALYLVSQIDITGVKAGVKGFTNNLRFFSPSKLYK